VAYCVNLLSTRSNSDDVIGTSITLSNTFWVKTAQGRAREQGKTREREEDNGSQPALESASRARGRARSFHLCRSLGLWTPCLISRPDPRPGHSLSLVSDVQSHPRLAHGAHSARLHTSTRAGNGIAAGKGTVHSHDHHRRQLAEEEVIRKR